MSASGQNEPRQQSFYGPGSFGGDNHGTVNNVLLDPKTKATLAKLSKDAPELADILKTALRDGIVSPDTVAALQSAVRHINDDVADRLWYAARNINEDVADRLWHAGQNINEEVANKFIRINDELNATVRNLEQNLNSMRATTAQPSSSPRSPKRSEPDPARIATANAARTAGVDMLHSSQSAENWRFRLTLVCCSSGVGLLAAVILMKHHFGGYATFAGVFALAIPVLFWIVKTRRQG
jgi:Flp pilus assembly protein TadB